MTQGNQQLVLDFFAALSAGDLSERLLTEDMSAWTLTSGDADKARFQGGAKMLASIFGGTLAYHIDAITAEDDRVVVECKSSGILTSGEPFSNVHVFSFRVRDGRIAHVAEFMNPQMVQEKIVPAMREMMAAASPATK